MHLTSTVSTRQAPTLDCTAQAIVAGMRDNNGVRKISSDRVCRPPTLTCFLSHAHNAWEQVRGFVDRYASDDYMLANPDTTLGAVHFRKGPSANISFVIQINTTVRILLVIPLVTRTTHSFDLLNQVKGFRDSYQDPNRFAQLPLQLASHRVIARHYLLKVVTP